MVTTATSTGAVNGAFESLTGIGGLVPMANLSYSESVFGGVGTGLYTMLLYVLLAVFIGGLMVGRTPEYLGKKIEAREVKLIVLGLLFTPLAILVATSLATATSYGAPSIYASGPQGFSESLYAYMSQANNNGSAFAGYTGYFQPEAGNLGAHGITFADLLGGMTMLLARFIPIVFALAVAGLMLSKRVAPAGLGTMRTDTPDVRGPARGHGRVDRRAHLLPRPAPRPRRAGHDRSALLTMKRNLVTSLLAVIVFTLLLGLAYPLVITGIAQVAFPTKADGDTTLIARDAKGDPRYFQPRPSQTEYNPRGTFFSNRGPNQASARYFYRDQLAAYLALEGPYNPGLTNAGVPADAVTTSGSGVDPHISEDNAGIQARRIAAVRNLPLARVQQLVEDNTDGRFLGLLGEPGVNVTKLNLALDR